MLARLARNWWMFALRGLIALLFSLVALLQPNLTLTALVLLFGAFALLDGVFAIASAIANRVPEYRGWVLFEGITGVIIGVVTVVFPNITELVLLYLIAGWSIVTGLFEILAAIDLHQVIEREWWLVLSGILSTTFGILVALQPQAGAIAITWMLGLYAILFGAILLILAFRLQNLHKLMTC